VISIVLATYNERDLIQTTIRALLKEAPEAMEIIVVDDDSPDQTWRVVESLELPNVRVIRRRRARGLASAFNRGIIESKGDYIGWMDADMCMPPSMIPEMYRKLVDEGYDVAIGSRYAPRRCRRSPLAQGAGEPAHQRLRGPGAGVRHQGLRQRLRADPPERARFGDDHPARVRRVLHRVRLQRLSQGAARRGDRLPLPRPDGRRLEVGAEPREVLRDRDVVRRADPTARVRKID
jgi:glycosyltransferase involved in cell wall biosynthesis